MIVRRNRVSQGLFLAVAAALLVAACGGSTESGASTVTGPVDGDGSGVTEPPLLPTPESSVAEVPRATEAPPATEASTTTVPTTLPPTTTAAPTTVPAPPPTAAPGPLTSADLILTSDGIGPIGFTTTNASNFVAMVTPALGAPTQFTAETYPTDSGGYFENEFEESGFDFPFGETVCFANALCAYFGGNAAADPPFVGYRQDENAAALRTASGVTSGSIWASFSAAISFEPGGCFSTGFGHADGVGIIAISSGEPFQFFDSATDTFVNQVPAQADVHVISLNAGAQPFFLFDDC